MNLSHINSRFLLRSLLVMAGTGLFLFFVHSWQMGRHAAGQLAIASQAEQEDNSEVFLAALNRYLSFDPGNKEVRARYALALSEKGTSTRDRWRALQMLTQAMTEMPQRSEVRVRAVELALALREPDQAGKYLEPLLQAQPDRADLHLLAARCEQDRGKPQAAAAALKQALRLAPDQVDTVSRLATLYRDRLGQPRLAKILLDAFVKTNPRLPGAYVARARAAIVDARLDSAMSDLETASKLGPNDSEVILARAEVEALRGQFNQASALFKRGISLAPQRIEMYLGLARIEQKREQTGAAIATLRRAKQQAPERIDILFGLADLLIDSGKTAEASDVRKRLASSAPGRSQFLAGRLAQHERRWLEGINAYNAAVQANDVRGELAGRAYFELSRCYAALGGQHEEMQALELAVRFGTDFGPPLVLAERLVQARRFADALPLLRILSQQPTSPRAVWPLLGRVLIEQNRLTPPPQRRWNEVEQAIERASGDPALEVALAILKADRSILRHDVPQGQTILESACQAHPKAPALYIALADLASHQGDFTALEAALERGDKVFENRLDWLAARIHRLDGQSTDQANRERSHLEARIKRLPPANREPLEQQLIAAHVQMGNHSEVERLCLKLLSYRPDNTQVRLWLIESLLARDEVNEAQRQIEDLRKREGGKDVSWCCARAELLMRKPDPESASHREEARRLLEQARKARPSWSKPVFLLARLDDRENYTDRALAGYRRVLELGDYRPVAVMRTLELLDAGKQWGEAFAICEQALQKGVLDRAMQRVAANLAIKANKPARAHELAALVVPEGNREYRDHIWLGGILDAAGRTTASQEAFEKAIGLAPDAIEPYLALIAHHVRHHHRADATRILDQMKSALEEPQSTLAVGRAYEIMALPDKAEHMYRTILSGQPRDADALVRLAALLVRLNKPAQAEAVLVQLLDPRTMLSEDERPEPRRQLALVLTAPEQKADRVEEALKLLDQNRRQLGDTKTDQRVRALVEGRRGDRRAAAIKFVEGLSGPLLPEEQFRLARLYDAIGNGSRARAVLLELIERDPSNPGTIAVLIDGLLRHNHRVPAAEWIDRLDKLEPGSARVKAFRERAKRREKGVS